MGTIVGAPMGAAVAAEYGDVDHFQDAVGEGIQNLLKTADIDEPPDEVQEEHSKLLKKKMVHHDEPITLDGGEDGKIKKGNGKVPATQPESVLPLEGPSGRTLRSPEDPPTARTNTMIHPHAPHPNSHEVHHHKMAEREKEKYNAMAPQPFEKLHDGYGGGLMNNHALHGALLGLAVGGVTRQPVLAIGVGTAAATYMYNYGHNLPFS
jgi:hypothetical protein